MSVWYAWSAGVRTTKSRATAAADARIRNGTQCCVSWRRGRNGIVTCSSVAASSLK
jgi:hypothetical protein